MSTRRYRVLPPFAMLLIAALIAFTSTIAQAQQPKLEMHRTGVTADDGTGWHAAVSTKGSFSVRMPIPFNDFTTHDGAAMSHVVGGKSSEGIKVVVLEQPITSKTPADLGTIPKSFSSNPANKVSGISRQPKDGADTLTFSVAGPASSMHVRYIKTKSAIFMLSIEFPNEHRDLVASMKDTFFNSFKLKAQS